MSGAYRKIEKCRICGNSNLVEVVDLGIQALTGVFPKHPSAPVTAGPLRLVKCHGDDVCGLLQLQHSYDLDEMYGLNYGYRSGLNSTMVSHLHAKVRRILGQVALAAEHIVLDIGSNDGTTLSAYPAGSCTLVGMDPTAAKFSAYYPSHVRLVPDFFSAARFRSEFGDTRAAVVTSFSMFYDLEDPTAFMREVFDILADDGIWVFEQSYMPTMLSMVSYDTICHEHLEYYALKQIQWMAERVGFRIVDIEFNEVNGGSFSVTVAKRDSKHPVSSEVAGILEHERSMALDTLKPYRDFAAAAAASCRSLRHFLDDARSQGKRVCGLGASTKGNVVLQYCGVLATDIESIGDVNRDKYQAYTPGTLIPIRAEEEVLATNPDYLLVLPWHFRRFFESNPKLSGRRLVFPLPQLEVVETP